MYVKQRNYNDNLHEGMSDGGFKKYAPNRGGMVEDATVAIRKAMSGAWHGFNQLKVMPLNDGTSYTSKAFNDIAPADKENI